MNDSALYDVADLADVPPETPVRVDVGGTPVCLVNVDGTGFSASHRGSRGHYSSVRSSWET